MKIIKFLEYGEPAGTRLSARISRSKAPGMADRPSRDEVALQAYFIYLQQGCPQGRDVQHWLEAEARTLSK